MPLRAIVDGQEVIAPLLDDEAWEALRRRVADENLSVILPCCQVEGYLRRSKYGTRHFAHKQSGNCAVRSETVEHLRAKADIVLACRAAGYDASTEVAGEGWRADVLATRGSTRVAFEVQWSFLRFKDALYRQRRYERDGVRGCWFFRRPPPAMRGAPFEVGPDVAARHDLPIFQLYVNADGSFAVALNNRLHALSDFVSALLRGRVRFCPLATADPSHRLRAVFVEIDCPRCLHRCLIYTVDTTHIARCGLRFNADKDWYSPDYAFHPALVNAVRRVQATASAHGLRYAEIKTHFDPASGQRAPAFACPGCGVLFTRDMIDVALYGATGGSQPLGSVEVTVRSRSLISGSAPHWCYPMDGRFCCGPTGSASEARPGSRGRRG